MATAVCQNKEKKGQSELLKTERKRESNLYLPMTKFCIWKTLKIKGKIHTNNRAFCKVADYKINTNTVYAEHLPSFWDSGILVCARQEVPWPAPNKNSGHWERTPDACSWFPPDSAPCAFSLGCSCFYLFTIILCLFLANQWTCGWSVGPSPHPNP